MAGSRDFSEFSEKKISEDIADKNNNDSKIKSIEVNEKDNVPEGNIFKTGNVESVMTMYFSEIGNEPLLTKSEEKQLMLRIKGGDQEAFNQMIRKNLRLVVHIALRYNNEEFGLMDRISEGNLGLIHAIEKFEVEKGFRFSTYAHWWIKQSIEKGIMSQGRSVRLPVHVVRLLSRYNKASCRISKADKASLSDIASELNCKPERLNKILTGSDPVMHLDGKSIDSEKSPMEIIADGSVSNAESVVQSDDGQAMLISILAKLMPYEHFILIRHMGLMHNERNTLKELSEITGFSKEQIRSRERKALTKYQDDLVAALK